MDDGRYTFISDVKDRKQMLSGARNMKRGSKSKKCTLPSDYLTASQKKKLNGEVKIYKMKEPITYDQFKLMPTEHQENYIVGLIDEYHVTGTQLAEMMGIAPKTLYNYLTSKNLSGYLPGKGHRMPKECRASWEKFLASKTGRNISVSTRTDEYYQKAEQSVLQADSESSSSEDVDAAVPVDLVSSCKMSSFSISYEGNIRFKEIAAYLELMLGANPKGHLDITFKKD